MNKEDEELNREAAVLLIVCDPLHLDMALEIVERTSSTYLSSSLAKSYWNCGEIDKGIRALNLHDGAYLDRSLGSVVMELIRNKHGEEIRNALKEQLPEFYTKIERYGI